MLLGYKLRALPASFAFEDLLAVFGYWINLELLIHSEILRL